MFSLWQIVILEVAQLDWLTKILNWSTEHTGAVTTFFALVSLIFKRVRVVLRTVASVVLGLEAERESVAKKMLERYDALQAELVNHQLQIDQLRAEVNTAKGEKFRIEGDLMLANNCLERANAILETLGHDRIC